MTEREVRASGRPALVGKMMMARVGRARERCETQGFMQVLVDAETKKILGAALLGIEADEAIHCIIDVMAAGAALHGDQPDRAHPSDGGGADPHAPWQPPAACSKV